MRPLYIQDYLSRAAPPISDNIHQIVRIISGAPVTN